MNLLSTYIIIYYVKGIVLLTDKNLRTKTAMKDCIESDMN